jgi:hypothetical protein
VGILFRAFQLFAPNYWGHLRKKMSVPVDKRAVLTHCTTSTSEKETTVRCLPVPVICAKENQFALSNENEIISPYFSVCLSGISSDTAASL